MVPGNVEVTRHHDESDTNHLDILTGVNNEGVVAATIGIMDFDQSRNPDQPINAEILMDVRGESLFISNILATIGFYVIKNGWKIAPGVIFEEMLGIYLPQSPTQHVIFLPPFQWKIGMTKVELSSKIVYPLLAIPITNAERDLVYQQGVQALEEHWTTTNCDVLNWNRKGKT